MKRDKGSHDFEGVQTNEWVLRMLKVTVVKFLQRTEIVNRLVTQAKKSGGKYR